MNFKGAGTIFTNNEIVLSGFNIKINAISGIGGKPNNYELPWETAIRETLEELFEINPSDELIININMLIKPNKIKNNLNYYLWVYTLNDLNTLLHFLKSKQTESKLYKKFPKNVSELILNRKTEITKEIRELYLLPFNPCKLSSDFIQDLQLIQK
jgi:hypothetical protein